MLGEQKNRMGIVSPGLGALSPPAHETRLLKRQRLGEPEVSEEKIFVVFRCQDEMRKNLTSWGGRW